MYWRHNTETDAGKEKIKTSVKTATGWPYGMGSGHVATPSTVDKRS